MSLSLLVEEIASRTGLPVGHVRNVLSQLPEVLSEHLQAEGALRWTGFGTYRLVERAARIGRNPRTGAPVPIPARRTLHFKPAKRFKEKVHG